MQMSHDASRFGSERNHNLLSALHLRGFLLTFISMSFFSSLLHKCANLIPSSPGDSCHHHYLVQADPDSAPRRQKDEHHAGVDSNRTKARVETTHICVLLSTARAILQEDERTGGAN